MMYRFRIKLKEISAPEVWREVLVPKGNTFTQFHRALQTAFGWKNEHLFEFSREKFRIAIPSEYDYEYDAVTYDADKMLISDYFGKDAKDGNDDEFICMIWGMLGGMRLFFWAWMIR